MGRAERRGTWAASTPRAHRLTLARHLCPQFEYRHVCLRRLCLPESAHHLVALDVKLVLVLVDCLRPRELRHLRSLRGRLVQCGRHRLSSPRLGRVPLLRCLPSRLVNLSPMGMYHLLSRLGKGRAELGCMALASRRQRCVGVGTGRLPRCLDGSGALLLSRSPHLRNGRLLLRLTRGPSSADLRHTHGPHTRAAPAATE